jgi:hypothetical protein
VKLAVMAAWLQCTSWLPGWRMLHFFLWRNTRRLIQPQLKSGHIFSHSTLELSVFNNSRWKSKHKCTLANV